MAKDPACLFYWGDWQGGTIRFTRHMKGAYMDLLTAQFNGGPLSLEEIKTVLGSDFGLSWPTLQKKFKVNGDGLFYNERLQEEFDKRRKYTESRRSNASRPPGSKKSDEHMVGHMDNENRNEDIIEDEIQIQYGKPRKFSITVQKIRTGEKFLVIHDLEVYFGAEKQLDQIREAGWTNFDKFLENNPGRMFDTKEYLYNAFKLFHKNNLPPVPPKRTPGPI